MKKLGAIVFLSFIMIFSYTTLATTWTQTNWQNSIMACGDYNSDCTSCGISVQHSQEDYTYVTRLSKGKWLIKISAENIQAMETGCCANVGVGNTCWNAPDCSVEIKEIGIKLKMDDGVVSGLEGKQTGTWLKISGDDCVSNTNSRSISPIYSNEIDVTCNNNNGCDLKYFWWITVNGFATLGSGSDYIYGNAKLDAKVEYKPGFGFSLSLNSTSGSVTQGKTIGINATTTLNPGATTQSVSFSASGLPSGATASFNPTSCNPTCSSIITISTSDSTPTGTYPITITATGGGVTETATYTLTVNQKPPFDFSISLDPNSGTVNKGSNIKSNVTLKLLSGDAQSVSLSYTIQPQVYGISVDFNPMSITPNSNGVNSTMTILPDLTTPVGTYTVTVTGTAGSLKKTAPFTLAIPTCARTNPTLALTPSSQSGIAGSILQYIVTVGNVDSGNDCTRHDFTLSTACPIGWTCTFASSILSVAPGSTNTTTLNVTSHTTATGSNSFNVIATSGSYTNISSAIYTVSLPCSGPVKLTLTPSTISPSGLVTPDASGLSNCDGKKVEFRNKTCTGEKIRECTISGSGCTGLPFAASGSLGSYTYFACIDKNSDDDFGDEGESNSTILTVANVCPRDNPSITSDISTILKEAGQSHKFQITVKNEDYQSCSDSIFKLSVDCPGGWTCTFDKSSLTISPKDTAITSLTIKSAVGSTGKHAIEMNVVNSVDSKYNNTITVNYNIGSKCDGAKIRIDDVSFSDAGVKIVVENNGTSNNLTIKSATITDKSNKQYTNSLSVGNFDIGDKEEIILNKNIPKCEDFSKLVVSTDCSSVSGTFDQKARCLSTLTAIVKIREAKYENGIVKIILKNDGSDSISSELIGLTISDEEVACKEKFILSPKASVNCSIDFACTDNIKLAVISPNKNETTVYCKPEISITPKTCKDKDSNRCSTSFEKGENVYLDFKADYDVEISASVYYNGEFVERIYPDEPFKPIKTGTYTINLTASKPGYLETVKKITFTVGEKSNGFFPKAVIILLFIAILAAFILYRLKRTKKRQSFEELYEKYRKANYSELYKKYGKKKRPLRRF